MRPLVARLLYAAAAAVGALPWSWLRALSDALAWTWLRVDARESWVARRNLELVYPEWSPAQRTLRHREVLYATARQALETVRMWTRPHSENLTLIQRSEGTDLFDAALAAGRGVIVAAPHYGNWELLNQWLAARTPLAILYRPPESALGEAFLRRVRADGGGRVTQVRAEGPGIRRLYKLLQDGGVVGILPDQQPKVGDGVFAPFFGIQASTMTLIGRLAERTGARVLFAYCERSAPDPAFLLRIETAPDDIASADTVVAVAALNVAVERIARRDPAQYQWTYKRFSRRAPDSTELNPYESAD
ncbi:MAG: lauroyl acyltransferase [Luteimonas sp.]